MSEVRNIISEGYLTFVRSVTEHFKGSDIRSKIGKKYKEFLSETKLEIVEEISRLTKPLIAMGTGRPQGVLSGYISQRNSVIKNTLEANGEYVWEVKMETASRLAINLSGGVFHSIFEIGVSLDPILGIPFIPSTSIKGAWRHAVWIILSNLSPDNADTLVKDFFDDVPVVVKVFDAYPIHINSDGGYLVIPDILNPHYTSSTRNELDVSPTPIIHLTIPRGIVFGTVIGIDVEALSRSFDESTAKNEEERRRIRERRERWEDLKNKLAERLNRSHDGINGLKNTILVILKAGLILAGKMGIGAKTSVGYSRLEVEIDEWRRTEEIR